MVTCVENRCAVWMEKNSHVQHALMMQRRQAKRRLHQASRRRAGKPTSLVVHLFLLVGAHGRPPTLQGACCSFRYPCFSPAASLYSEFPSPNRISQVSQLSLSSGSAEPIIILIERSSGFLQFTLYPKEFMHSTKLDRISSKCESKVVDFDLLTAGIGGTLSSSMTGLNDKISYYLIKNPHCFWKRLLRQCPVRSGISIGVKKKTNCTTAKHIVIRENARRSLNISTWRYSLSFPKFSWPWCLVSRTRGSAIVGIESTVNENQNWQIKQRREVAACCSFGVATRLSCGRISTAFVDESATNLSSGLHILHHRQPPDDFQDATPSHTVLPSHRLCLDEQIKTNNCNLKRCSEISIHML